MWEVLYERYLESTLLGRIYIPPDETARASPETMPCEAKRGGSSSSFQECPERIEEHTPGTMGFPVNEAVEEAPFVPVDDNTDDAHHEDNKEEAAREALQHAMERWVEMVECVDMLESIDWLHTLPDTDLIF